MSLGAAKWGAWLVTPCLLMSTIAAGCGLRARSTRSAIDTTRVQRAEELRANERAPVAYERFSAAKRAAERSPDESVARGDYASEARLWLEVALAEAERQELSDQRLAEERTLAELDAEVVRLSRAQAALARDNELAAAQAQARAEAERALARAAQRPEVRVKLPREEVRRAAEALTARAELIALTLRALGKESPALERLQRKLAETRALAAKEPEASLARADESLFDALGLLTALRDAHATPDDEEKAALAEALALAGTRVVRVDRGLAGLLAHAFARQQLTPEAARIVERLCALAKAHPSGPVQLSVQGRGPLSEARLRAVRERLRAEGCSGDRFVFTAQEGASDELEASFLSY